MADKNDPSADRVYGGNHNLIHIDDGERGLMGVRIAEHLEMRVRGEYRGDRTPAERVDQDLCPGCYMIAGFNMLVTLAENNHQDMGELARCMANAFNKLAENPSAGLTEEIEILLDPCD